MYKASAIKTSSRFRFMAHTLCAFTIFVCSFFISKLPKVPNKKAVSRCCCSSPFPPRCPPNQTRMVCLESDGVSTKAKVTFVLMLREQTGSSESERENIRWRFERQKEKESVRERARELDEKEFIILGVPISVTAAAVKSKSEWIEEGPWWFKSPVISLEG